MGNARKRHPPNSRNRYKGRITKADATDDPGPDYSRPGSALAHSRPGSALSVGRPGSALSVGRPGDSVSTFIPPPPGMPTLPSRSTTPAPSRSAPPSRATTPAFGRRAPSRPTTPAIGPSMLDDELEDYDLTQLPSLTTIDGDEVPLPVFSHPFSRADSSNAIYDPYWFTTAWKAFPEESVFIGALLLTDYWLAAEILPPTLLAALKSLFQVWVTDSASRSEVHETVKALWTFLKTVHVTSIDRVLNKAQVAIIATPHDSNTEDEPVTNMFQQLARVERGVKSYVKLQGALLDLGKNKTAAKARHRTLDEAARAICWLLAYGIKCGLECHFYTSATCYCPYHAVYGQPDTETTSEPLLNLAYTCAITLVQDMAKAEGPEATVIPKMLQLMQIDVAAALSTTFYKPLPRYKIEAPSTIGAEAVVQPKEETITEPARIQVRLNISFFWVQQTFYLANNQPFRHVADIWRKVIADLAMDTAPPRYFIFIWNGRQLGMEERPVDVGMKRKANLYVLDAAEVCLASMYDYDTFREEALRAFNFRIASGFKTTDRFNRTMNRLETSLKLVGHEERSSTHAPKPAAPKPTPVVQPSVDSPMTTPALNRPAQTPTTATVTPKEPAFPTPSLNAEVTTPKEGDLVVGSRVRTLAARFSTISLNAAAAAPRPPQSRSVSAPRDAVAASSLHPFGLSASTNSRSVSGYDSEGAAVSRPATPYVASPASSSTSKIASPMSSPTHSGGQTLNSLAPAKPPVASTPPLSFPRATTERRATIPRTSVQRTTAHAPAPSRGMHSPATKVPKGANQMPPAPAASKSRSQSTSAAVNISGLPTSSPQSSKSSVTRQAGQAQAPVEGKATWSSIKTSAGRLFK